MFIEIDGLTIHVEADGPQQGEAVLLLHSLGTNLHVWDPQAAALARTHRVLRPDLRGHGLTESAARRLHHGAVGARCARPCSTRWSVRRAHVCGMSIGGRIAMDMAALAPDRIASLMPLRHGPRIPPAPRCGSSAWTRSRRAAWRPSRTR